MSFLSRPLQIFTKFIYRFKDYRVLTALLLGFFCLWTGLRSLNQMNYEGLPLKTWFARWISAGAGTETLEGNLALAAFRYHGEAGIRVLASYLIRQETILDKAVVFMRRQAPIIMKHWMQTWKTPSQFRYGAASMLREFGVSSAPAIPELIKALVDPDPSVSRIAQSLLVKLSPLSVDKLTQALDEDSIECRMICLSILTRIGPGARTSEAEVRKKLNDPHPGVCLLAAEAIWKITGDHQAATVALDRIGKKSSPSYQREMVNLISRIGPEARGASNVLIRALDFDNPYVRLEANSAFATVLGLTNAAMTGLVQILKHPDHNVRWAALAELDRLLPASKSVMSDITAAVQDSDRYVRSAAISLLGKMGSDASKATPLLKVAAKDGDTLIQSNAAESLWKIDPNRFAKPQPAE